MNLHSIVRGAITGINPDVDIQVQASDGYETSASGKRTPKYADPEIVKGNVQPLQSRDLAQVDGMNLQGVLCKIYLNGFVHGAMRADGSGGALLTTPDGRTWIVKAVLEQWPDWVCVACVLQLDQ